MLSLTLFAIDPTLGRGNIDSSTDQAQAVLDAME